MSSNDLIDPRRSEPAYDANERDMLEGWLNFHRVTLVIKCEGLDDAQRNLRPIPTSSLSLHGLVRHLSEVEHYWTSIVLMGSSRDEGIYCDDAAPDADFDATESSTFESDLAIFHEQCRLADARMAQASLESLSIANHHGQPITVRWILTHLIEEYARHNGHADLIRELIDGAVGC